MSTYPELAGKVAIITGSGRPKGLGAAIARRLAADGCRIVIHDIGTPKGETMPEHGVGKQSEMDGLADELRAMGGEVSTFTADLLVEAEVEALVAHAVERFGGLDIFVNNAGIGFLVGAVTEMSVENWDAVIGVNLRGAFLGMKHAARAMIAGGRGGRIVSIGSQAGKSGVSLMSAYSSSKHGLIGLTRSAAIELGKEGITVNAVCPNHVPTDLGNWQRENLSRIRGVEMDDYWERFRARVPLGKPGTPEDTANACAFLCSEAARYITGEAMNVSGGEEYH